MVWLYFNAGRFVVELAFDSVGWVGGIMTSVLIAAMPKTLDLYRSCNFTQRTAKGCLMFLEQEPLSQAFMPSQHLHLQRYGHFVQYMGEDV